MNQNKTILPKNPAKGGIPAKLNTQNEKRYLLKKSSNSCKSKI